MMKNTNTKTELSQIIHQIRNLKLLNNDTIRNINSMSHDDKIQIIITYNSVIERLKDLIDEL
jgi:hypothetical protein